MNEEEKITEEYQNGLEAQKLLDNRLFKGAFIKYQANLIQSLKTTEWDQQEKREEIYRQLKSLDTVEAELSSIILTGKMAKQQLSLMQKAAKVSRKVVGL